jgi:hypothetical protein
VKVDQHDLFTSNSTTMDRAVGNFSAAPNQQTLDYQPLLGLSVTNPEVEFLRSTSLKYPRKLLPIMQKDVLRSLFVMHSNSCAVATPGGRALVLASHLGKRVLLCSAP